MPQTSASALKKRKASNAEDEDDNAAVKSPPTSPAATGGTVSTATRQASKEHEKATAATSAAVAPARAGTAATTTTSKGRGRTTRGSGNGTSSSIGASAASSAASSTMSVEDNWQTSADYTPMNLKDIHKRILELCYKVPHIPDDGFKLPQEANGTDADAATATSNNNNGIDSMLYDKQSIRRWATLLQTVLEEFNLLVACIPAATYVWGTDRSGAADQFLTTLSNELVRSQEQLLSRVTPRLNDVLAPVVTLVTDKTITIKKKKKKTSADDAGGEDEAEEEVKQNYFKTTLEDPDYVNLCFTILARNAFLLRQVVLSNFDKLLKCIGDYLDALSKDSQHGQSRSGYVY